MKALVFLAVLGLASCADFNPSPEQIQAMSELAKVLVDAQSGK